MDSVYCVVIHSDQSVEEIHVPHGEVHTHLTGKLQIVGAIDELNAIAVSGSETGLAEQRLPENNFEPGICGDVIVVRTVGDGATPIDIRAPEVETWLKQYYILRP
tara:strand:+ start:1268 stop:1582 length:315 start_codon:yes stop_codon:yes gene_type:complete